MSLSRRSVCAAVLACALSVGLGCGGGSEIVVKTASGSSLSAEALDADPVVLLPAGAVAWMHLNRSELVKTPLGQRLSSRVRQQLPSAVATTWEKVEDAWVASYTSTGANVVAVLRGGIEAASLEKASRSGALQIQPYGERAYYSSPGFDWGLALITSRTALIGTRTALHRALDRIADRRVEQSFPPWVVSLLATPGSAVSIAVSPGDAPLSAAVQRQAGFLSSVVSAQSLGNIDASGLNWVGTLTHRDHSAAKASASGMLNLGQVANLYGRLLGLSRPVRKMETQALDNDTQFAVSVSTAAVDHGLRSLPNSIFSTAPQNFQ